MNQNGNGYVALDAVVMDAFFKAMNKAEQQKVDTGRITSTTEFSEETRKIILPKGMSKLQASEDLKNQWNNEENKQVFAIQFEKWDYKDALVAIKKVTEQEFGWLNMQEGFFSKPTEISIKVDIKEGKAVMEKAFVGKMKLTPWEDAAANVGVSMTGIAGISIEAKKKYASVIDDFFARINNHLDNHSIYRGRAMEVIQGPYGLEFELIELKENSRIVLNDEEESIVENFILDQLGEKEKRTYLFSGGYGNGKTETANRIGIEGLKNGRSFFYVKRAENFTLMVEKSRQYEPVTIFVEDIDEVASGEDRDESMNNILNVVDGVQTKGRDIVSIFTTNSEDGINSALRRPGRIDMIIRFSNPTKDKVQKIGEKFLSEILGSEEIDWELVKAKVPDVSGAVVAEIFKRALKIATKRNLISTEIILASINSMAAQIEFMKKDSTKVDPEIEMLQKLREYFNGSIASGVGVDL